MASSSNPNPLSTPPLNINFDPNINLTPNTTFVQADPSNFRAVVQRLTGATPNQTAPPTFVAGKTNSGKVGMQRSAFKLHERRQTARKLEIKLNDNNSYKNPNAVGVMNPYFVASPSCVTRQVMVSPVSTLDFFLGRGSPRTPMAMSPEEEEERAIAQKGFYLHPSPRGMQRGGGGGGGVEPPQLLTLFPLESPSSNNNNSQSSSFLTSQSP